MNNIDEAVKMQQKMNSIHENTKQIQENLKSNNTPIFIELMGTPKSGKTTLTRSLKTLFERSEIDIDIRRETAEYNPISKEAESYNLWMMLELFKNLIEDIENGKGKIIIYDRGIIDRIAWLNLAVQDGSITESDLEVIKRLYGLKTIREKYKPIVYGFYTTPELSIKRKGRPGKFVNEQSLNTYNEKFLSEQNKIRKMAARYKLIETDPYEGRIEDFILDCSLNLTDLLKSLTKNKELEEK